MAPTLPAPKQGDPCPIDGGELVAQRAPTDEERAAAANQDTPLILPGNVDTATKAQRAELGALYQCRSCGYKTRIKDGDDQGDASRDRSRQAEDAGGRARSRDRQDTGATRGAADPGATGPLTADEKDAEISRLRLQLADSERASASSGGAAANGERAAAGTRRQQGRATE